MSANIKELFPTKLTAVIFHLYMSLFIGQGILVTASQESNNSYSYNTITVVLSTEVLRLIVASTLYCRENNLRSLVRDVRKDSNVLLLYIVPAFLYCLYNNLAFVNLTKFDPTTYYLLLQLRIVVTGILFQIVFKKYLTQRQWLSLILLTFGCMLKQLNFNSLYKDAKNNSVAVAEQTSPHQAELAIKTMKEKNMTSFDLSLSAVLILAQIICSCLAGVYVEYLLKDKGTDVNIFVQNVFMCINSIVCNIAVLLFRNELLDAFTIESLSAIFRFSVIILIINNTAIGIVTSLFLKYMNSILKTFASALQLLFTAVFCYFLFALPINLNTALAIAVVLLAIYLYSQSPVVNTGKVRSIAHWSEAMQSDKRKLLYSYSHTDLEKGTV